MSAVAKNRKRIRVLELTVQGLQRAVHNTQRAQLALNGKKYRRPRDEGSEEMVAARIRNESILQAIFLSDRKQIRQFIENHVKTSDVHIEKLMDLDSVDVDFHVLFAYLKAKKNSR